jgi:minimal PKS chain-length factor (CLF/KS beta)
MKPRVVITGIGVVAPSGMSAAEHWATVTAGTNRLAPISFFDASGYPAGLAGEISDFDASDRVEGRLAVQTDRWTHLAFAATEQAIADAGLDLARLDPYDLSIVMASSSGGNDFGQRELQRLWALPARKVGAYQSIAWFYAATVGQLSIRHQAKGPSNVLASESAGGIDSLIHAARTVGRGTPVVLSGGIEAPLSPYALACQLRSNRLSTQTDPLLAYRPFDARASGYVPGEGGAVLIVEELEHALAREAPRIWAEIAGWGATHDGRATSGGRAYGHRAAGGGDQYARSMRLALERGGTEPGQVDLLIPDALGVPEYDRSEAAAIGGVFGRRGVPVTSHKSLVGRLYQGGSALDVATALLAMREQAVPGIAGLDQPADGCDLDFVRATAQRTVDQVLVCARGFDGYNSSLLLRRYPCPSTEAGA